MLGVFTLHFAILGQDQTFLDLLFILERMVIHVLAISGGTFQFDEIIL